MSTPGNLRRTVKSVYDALRRAGTTMRTVSLLAKQHLESATVIESLQKENEDLRKAIRNNPRIERLEVTLKARDHQITELEKQLRQCKPRS